MTQKDFENKALAYTNEELYADGCKEICVASAKDHIDLLIDNAAYLCGINPDIFDRESVRATVNAYLSKVAEDEQEKAINEAGSKNLYYVHDRHYMVGWALRANSGEKAKELLRRLWVLYHPSFVNALYCKRL